MRSSDPNTGVFAIDDVKLSSQVCFEIATARGIHKWRLCTVHHLGKRVIIFIHARTMKLWVYVVQSYSRPRASSGRRRLC